MYLLNLTRKGLIDTSFFCSILLSKKGVVIMTVEKRLKDYKGFQVWKIIDNKGMVNEEVVYMLNDYDGNNVNCFETLAELKKF